MEKPISKRTKQLIFLIGAARSGTKIVRDVLGTHPKISAVPYDINFIWRTGNENIPHDELRPEDFKFKSHQRIDHYLNRYLKGSEILVEKTVSNTIRIPFILKHYPDAKFVFLYRNGMDVCESVMRQWTASSDKSYLLEKIKHVPLKELLTYGIKVIARRFGKKEKFFWGVNYPELKEDLARYPIEILVAHQWKYCVDKMLLDKQEINNDRLFEIRYEDFVLSPKQTINGLINFIDPSLETDEIDVTEIKQGNIGKSSELLSTSQHEIIGSIIGKTMEQLNYEI